MMAIFVLNIFRNILLCQIFHTSYLSQRLSSIYVRLKSVMHKLLFVCLLCTVGLNIFKI